jgi:hypothetical protein
LPPLACRPAANFPSSDRTGRTVTGWRYRRQGEQQ